jgi:RNA polymerase sigma-70 factor (ECF subfamily)
MPLVYDELRRLAGAYMRREKSGHTLQSTAVVHEAFLKLVQQRDVQWRNRAHFFGIAAQMIRRILVDHARLGLAEKRGSGGVKVELNDVMAVANQREVDVLQLDAALAKLAQSDERQAKIVELRFFAGMSVEETAEVVQLSPATVKREWSSAKAWLFREMSRSGAPA